MTLEAWHSCGVIPRIPSAAFRIYAMHLKPFIFEGTTKWIEQLYCKQSKWDWIQFSCCCFVDGRPCVFCCPPTQLKASSCIFLSSGSKQPQLYSPCTRHTGHIYIHISISLEWPSIAASQSRIMPFVCWIKLHWLRQCAMVKSIMHLRHRSHGRTRHTDENGDKNTMFYLHFAAWGATERKSPQHRWRKKGHTFVTVSLCVCVCTTVEDNSRAISNDDTMYAYVEDVLRYFLLDLQQYMWPGFFFCRGGQRNLQWNFKGIRCEEDVPFTSAQCVNIQRGLLQKRSAKCLELLFFSLLHCSLSVERASNDTVYTLQTVWRILNCVHLACD